ncbi:MAG: response regulator transcription factor [Clostridia bacterium]|nr:response regulator transcription factor [Clostridia bacterium]
MKILLAEDDLAISTVLEKRLKFSGYDVTVVDNGEDALAFVMADNYDIVISDIMMPKMDGIELLKAVRAKKKDVPVLFLTAKDSTSDVVTGLDSGADDYMVKPFEFSELFARIRLLTRRRYGSRENVYSVGDLTIDAMTRKVERAGREITLSKKEYELLLLLVQNKNIVISKERISDRLYGLDDEIESNTIAVYINFLRKKVDDGFDKKLIETIRGVGYTIKD